MWTSLSERRIQTDGQLTYWGLDPAALLPPSCQADWSNIFQNSGEMCCLEIGCLRRICIRLRTAGVLFVGCDRGAREGSIDSCELGQHMRIEISRITIGSSLAIFHRKQPQMFMDGLQDVLAELLLQMYWPNYFYRCTGKTTSTDVLAELLLQMYWLNYFYRCTG
ncbi:uncharacterized protein LOC128231111 [Mya arenaria]|uniref:uncharacterized protein LOC128231111 n=1 Tax=Mya arenaria TaxID=6604 RepID=UPI0022E0A475|nr:uncharacterized protein LOC128231111 [Mya arenaria]